MVLSTELTLQTMGAVLVFLSTRLCHWAFATSIHVWFMSPKNRCVFMREFASQATKGFTDFSLLLKHHPVTLSETFGDLSTAEGQMVEATVRPAAVVMLVGSVLMHMKGGNVFTCLFSAIRGASAPFGLLMIMSTPVISGAGGSNARIRKNLPVSDFNLLYTFQWVTLHFCGFFSFIGPTVWIELPVAIADLMNPPASEGAWPVLAKSLWYCLAVLRVVCPVLLFRVFPDVYSTKVKNPNTLGAKKWNAELCAGELGSAVMSFNAISVFLLPSQAPYTWAEVVVIAAMVADSVRILFSYGLWTLWLLTVWDTVDIGYECMARSMAQGPIMTGLRSLTKKELVFLHAVQAGHFDKTEWCFKASPVPSWVSNGALGIAQGPVRLLVIRPESYENFNAFDFLDMHVEDLNFFCQDLLAVLEALPTATTLFFPFGDVYKRLVRRPILCISCADFDAEIARIAGPKLEVNTASLDCGPDEVAFDITEKVLSAQECLRGRSFLAAMAKDNGPELLKLFGTLLSPTGYEESERPDLGPHYEVQVRGLRDDRPTFILRTSKMQSRILGMLAGWKNLPAATLLPEELSTGGAASTGTKKSK